MSKTKKPTAEIIPKYEYLVYYDRSVGTYDPLFRLHADFEGAKKYLEDKVFKNGDEWNPLAQEEPLWQWESHCSEYVSIIKMEVHE